MQKYSESTSVLLSVGQHVSVEDEYGTIQYIGPVHFADGLWCGVELNIALGNTNGTINNVCYFTCDNNHGIFVPASMCMLDDSAVKVESNIKLLECTSTDTESGNLKSKKKALNESYVISDNFSEKKKLCVISEEAELIYSENLSCLCNTENIFPNSQNIKSFSANSVDKVDKILECDVKVDDLTDSDDSLGILPDLLENLTAWDSLQIDLEKSNDLSNMGNLSSKDDLEKSNDLSNMGNLSSKDTQNLILGSPKISAELDSDSMVINSTCLMPNISFSYNEEGDSPIQAEKKFPKFTSTPKHEINFSDVDDEDILTFAPDLFPGLFQEKSSPEEEHQTVFDDKVKLERNSLSSPNINLSNVNISEYKKNERNSLLNTTLTYPAEISKESGDLYEKQSEVIPNLPENEENNIVEILNTTYEKRNKSPKKNTNEDFLDSKNSNEDAKENMSLHSNVSESYDTAKISSFQTATLLKKEEDKQKFERKTRKSIATLHGNNKLKSKADNTQVRRNSFAGCANSLLRKNLFEPKVAKTSQIYRLSLKYSVKHGSYKSSVSSLEKSTPINNGDKNVPSDLSLKTEGSVNNVEEVKPVSKVSSQECLLNETINISPVNVSVEKTTVKKTRNSLNVFWPTQSWQPASEAYERNSKLCRRKFSACYQSQNQVPKNITEDTAVFQKTFTSNAVPKRGRHIPRLPIPTFYPGKNNVPSAAVTERKCIPSIRSHSAIHKSHKHSVSGYSSKSTHFEIKACQPKSAVNLNETVLISDTQTMQKQFTIANDKPTVYCPTIAADSMGKKYEYDDKVNLNNTVILSDHKSTQRQTFAEVAGKSQIHHPLIPADYMDEKSMEGGEMTLNKAVMQSGHKSMQKQTFKVPQMPASTRSVMSSRLRPRPSRLPQHVKSSVVPKKSQIFKKQKLEDPE